MNYLADFIVILWFLPVIAFVVLPLFVGVYWILSKLFDAFKPVAGQASKPIKMSARKRRMA